MDRYEDSTATLVSRDQIAGSSPAGDLKHYMSVLFIDARLGRLIRVNWCDMKHSLDSATPPRMSVASPHPIPPRCSRHAS